MKRTSLLTRLVCVPRQIIAWYYINPKKAGGSIWPLHLPPLAFRKVSLLKKGGTLIFCDFYYYHKSHLSWKFHWNYSSCSEGMRNFSVNISQFSSIFWIFWHFFVTNKLLMSACNRWRQHFFTFNIFQTDCLTICWY